MKHYLGDKTGPMIELETGNQVGTHEGVWFYTIGQRHGLGLAGGPWYVAQKNIDTNTLYISRNYYSPEKKRNLFHVKDCNWFIPAPEQQKTVLVKMRHGAHMHPAVVMPEKEGVTVRLAERDQGIAPGQFAVFYDGDLCLGGGVIGENI